MKPTNKANYQGLPGPPPYPPMQLPPRSSLLDSIFNVSFYTFMILTQIAFKVIFLGNVFVHYV